MEFRKRCVAFIIDHFVVIAALVIGYIIERTINSFVDISYNRTANIVIGILVLFDMLYYFAKDVVNGKSIGKRIAKIKVVRVDGNAPSILQLIIRNVTILIWPVEALLLLAGKKKLGDMLAKTDVVVE